MQKEKIEEKIINLKHTIKFNQRHVDNAKEELEVWTRLLKEAKE